MDQNLVSRSLGQYRRRRLWVGGSVSGDKFIGVCTEAQSIMAAEAADFYFYWRYSEVLADDRVWHVPGGIHY
jgi:hypothetical protein